ncbi:Glutathione-regulated potassium-efflux system protein KefB [uncultured archaeon]|nr:Glutathione-regulated potassium-efflux system protein KefB [uncultured archaeon]
MILMCLGVLISPSLLSIAFPGMPPLFRSEEVLQVFAQLGAVILLFKVGLHHRIEGVFRLDNVLVATAGVIFPFAAGYFYASMAGGSFAYSMFIGAALTATSVGVTVALLREFGLLEKRFSQIIIGAAVIDDILGLLVLSFVINVAGGADSVAPLLLTAASAAIFIIGGVLAGKHFVKYLDRGWDGGSALLLSLAFMLTYAYIAELVQLSAIIGAFLAGIVLNQSRHREKIDSGSASLELVFMPIFFISLGLLIDVNALWLFAVPIIAITLIAFFSKIIACALASLLAGLKKLEALAVGIGMVPRGEVALIVASIGLTSGILDSSQYSVIAAMAFLTTLAVPPLLMRALEAPRMGK